MKLKNRFLLIGVGLTIFTFITPLLVFYGRGFKFDFKNWEIIKTGSLVVATQPNEAQILLNGTSSKKDSPAILRFLQPQDYTITVKKDGYQEWTKRLSVRPQLATWANLGREFVTLFLQTPELKNEIPADQIFKSDSGDALSYIYGKQLYHLNRNRIHGRKINSANPVSTEIQQKINYEREGINLILNELLTNVIASSRFSQIQAIASDNKNTAVLLDSGLYIMENNNLVFLANPVSTMTVNQEYLWYIQDQKLQQFNFNTRSLDTISSNLPESQSSQIIRADNYLFLILDNTLYRFNETLETIYFPVSHTSWDSESSSLVLANDNEILIYNPFIGDAELVLRSVSPIKNAVINDETGYVFFSNENNIKAIELDGRDHRNVYFLAQGEDFIVSEKGDMLTVVEPTGLKIYRIR